MPFQPIRKLEFGTQSLIMTVFSQQKSLDACYIMGGRQEAAFRIV